uniref:Ankyrin repeat domain-containing protein n=1 Tax=Ananas comosus var. bracteatus TaxID=296719 RepID=A0A6V7PZ80_ANACO|nr:unnamed protein product [Ananas comosus var. bracteatus]
MAEAAGGIEVGRYAHSPVHRAVAARDHAALRRILAALPRLAADPAGIRTEAESAAEEARADAISAVVDRRDVPGRETPLHVAVRLGDAAAVEMLMAAGADWSLQNEQGWSALQEAICAREEGLAKIIVRHYQPLAWAKWCRRLPRLVAAMRRMRDFYMEITFHFESSVIPFISRIAPSDTYKIWKRGSNLRADMTLAGFDGFRIQRSDQSILFLGDGSEDGKSEVEQEVSAMSQTNIFRPGIDVTQAVLLPQLTWRRQERTEMVGPWKAKVYDMHNVVVSVKSRRVPGAMTDEEFFSSCNENDTESEEFEEILTEDERKQLENALKMESPDIVDEVHSDSFVGPRRSCYESREIPIEEGGSSCGNGESSKNDKKGWFGNWGRKGQSNSNKQDAPKRVAPPRSSLCVDEKVSDLLGESPSRFNTRAGRHSVEVVTTGEDLRRVRDRVPRKGAVALLDILANKVKAIRRLRELLTTKLPAGTFPVKVAIPVVPTIRVIVTFTKFEELQPSEEFSTPPSSPTRSKSPAVVTQSTSSSWIQWIKAPYRQNYTTLGPSSRVEDIQDPFAIPSDYTWTTPEAKKKKMMESKNKSKKGKNPKQ